MIAPALTNAAPTRGDLRERLVLAAVEWVFDQTCSAALAELEDAAQDYIGRNLDGSERGAA